MEENSKNSMETKKKRIKSPITKQKDLERQKLAREKKKQRRELEIMDTNTKLLREYEKEIEDLKQQLIEKDIIINKWRNKLEEQKEELEKERNFWKNKLELIEKEGKTTKLIAENSKRLVQDLSPNSPYHRPLLAYLMNGLAKETAMDYFDISSRSYKRIVEEEGNSLLEVKYTVNVECNQITKEQIEEIQHILDDILPKQSGREWRTQEETDENLYEQYLAAVQKGKKVSKTFFIYTILKKESIHHSEHPSFCILCERYENGERDFKLQQHKDLIPIQRGQYTKEKLAIGKGDIDTALITQDFTQIQYEGGFTQDLIITIYTYDSKEKDGIKRLYRHFIGNSDQKNNISFVIGCWMVLLEEKRLDNITNINIWSDGGPKHFKISANIRFLLSLQHARPNQSWSYNFFPSYHGCSVCDAAASHIKQKVNQEQRNSQIAIRNPEGVVAVGNQLNKHEVTLASITTTKLEANTLKGIKRYHKFTTSKEKNIIYAYIDSTQSEYTKKFHPRDIVPLDDIIIE